MQFEKSSKLWILEYCKMGEILTIFFILKISFNVELIIMCWNKIILYYYLLILHSFRAINNENKKI